MRFLGLFAVLAMLLFVPAGPAVSADPTPELTVLDRIGGASADVATGNGFVYVGDGYGIVTFDARGGTPAGLGRTLLPAPVRRLHLAGTTLAAVNGQQVTLLDLSDPAQPVIRSTYRGDAPVNDAYVAGDLLALGTWAGVETLDISDRSNPQPLDQLALDAGVASVVLDGARIVGVGVCDRAYALSYCVTVVNAADPTALAVDGERVEYESLILYNLVGSSLAISGDLAVVSGVICCRFGSSMRVYTVNLATRTVVGHVSWPLESWTSATLAPHDVAVVGGAMLVSSEKGLTVVSLSAAEPPARLRDVALPLPPTGLAVQGAQGYAGLADGGVLPINLSDPLQPAPGAPVRLLGSVYGLAAAGPDLADLLTINGYSANSELTRFRQNAAGVWLADAPLSVPFSSLAPGPANIHALVSGEIAPYSLRLLDASGSGVPVLGPALEVDTAQTIAFNLPYLYFSAYKLGTVETEPVNELYAARFAPGAAPELVNTLTMNEATYALTVADDRLYRLSATRFEVYDLSDPAVPAFLGSVDLPENTQPSSVLAVRDGVAYLGLRTAEFEERVLIIDARDSAEPVFGAALAEDFRLTSALLNAGRLFVSGQSLGESIFPSYRVRQYDVSDPLAPALVGEAMLNDPAQQPMPSGVGVAVAAGQGGVIRLALLNEQLWLPVVGRADRE